MKVYITYTILCLVLCSGCKKNRPRMDPEDPRLPAYTEQGLNTSGVLINDTLWSGTTKELFHQINPLEIHCFPNADSVLLLFNGSYRNGLESLSPTKVVFIILRNLQIRTDE